MGILNIDQIDQFVIPFINDRRIPGVAVTVVDRGIVQCRKYGYADSKNNEKVNDLTLFEIGSMSKAFTALGILWLENQGKISCNDNVKQYLPWFEPYYIIDKKRMVKDIKILDLLYHTSGIPFQTLFNIPYDDNEQALYSNIWRMRNIKLVAEPGVTYHYSSNNYNVLAYIIEQVTQESYELFIQKTILYPLGLFHTYLSREEARKKGSLSCGHKLSFFKQRSYNAPFIRGNLAGGYIMSCIHDMSRWLRIQMGIEDIGEEYKTLINKSHEGKYDLKENPGYKIAAAWHINNDTDVIQYMGSNPNFSSKIIFSPSKLWGICVLANSNSSATYYLADNILKCSKLRLIPPYCTGVFQKTDFFFTLLCGINVMSAMIIIPGLILGKPNGVLGNGLIYLNLFVFWSLLTLITPYLMKKTFRWKAFYAWTSPAILTAYFLGLISTLIAFLLCISIN